MLLKPRLLLNKTFSKVHQDRSLYLAPPFLVHDYEPIALATHRQGRLRAKVEDALHELEACRACPRNCGVNRIENQVEFRSLSKGLRTVLSA